MIADFGLAKRLEEESGRTQTGAIVGTPSYMAPEQAEGRKGGVTTLADVYSLGAILYELLTGRPPFRAELPLETLRQVREEVPRSPGQLNPGVDRNLETICLKCLEKDPQRRYATAAALAEDLEHWLAGEPIQARPPGLAQLLWLWLRKNTRVAVWAVLVGLLCGGFASWALGDVGMTTLFRQVAQNYAKFPSLKPSVLAGDWSSGRFGPVVRALGLIALFGAGLFCSLLVRPRDRFADVATGLTTGLVAGLTAFTLSLGLAAVLEGGVVTVLGDLQLLANGYQTRTPPDGAGTRPRAHPQDALLQKYPDLAGEPEQQRSQLLMAKIVSDIVTGSLVGIWYGMLLGLISGAAVVVCEALAAGYLLRTRGPLRAVIVPYCELVIPSVLAIEAGLTFLLVVLNPPGEYPPKLKYGLPLLLVLTAVAGVGVTRRWRALLRWNLYAAWFLTSFSPLADRTGFWPWYLGLIPLAGAVALLAHDRDLKRRGLRPALPPAA